MMMVQHNYEKHLFNINQISTVNLSLVDVIFHDFNRTRSINNERQIPLI